MKKRILPISIAAAIIAFCVLCAFIVIRIRNNREPTPGTAEVSMYTEETTENSSIKNDETTSDTNGAVTSTTKAENSENSEKLSTTAKENSVKENFTETTSTSKKNSTASNVTPSNNGSSNGNNVSNNKTNKKTQNNITTTPNSKTNNNKTTTKTAASTQKAKTTTAKHSTTGTKTTTAKTTTKTTTTKQMPETTEAPIVTSPPLTPVNPNYELFGAYYNLAEQTLSNMTLEEKVGQMFLSSYPGYWTAANQVNSNCPAGYVLFAADFQYQTPYSITNDLNNLKSNSKYGLLLGADEEGGDIVRVSMFSAFRAFRFQSPQALFNQGGLQAIFDEAQEKALLLKSIGLNYNLAPVVDMPKNPYSYIYGRTLGQDAQTTAEFAAGVVNIMNSNGMLATLKHFPGYGDNVDTHVGVAVDYRDRSTFDNEDLVPFVSGIQAGAPMIMVNHNIIMCMDGSKPASLSEEVHRVLREDLGFTGLIVTDGLTMGAVSQYASNGQAAVQAVLCGNDLIATTDYVNQSQEVLNAVYDGRIPEIMVNDAVRRVLACKYYYGLL